MTRPAPPRDPAQARRFHIVVVAVTLSAAGLLLLQTNANAMDIWGIASGYGSWVLTLWLLGFLVWVMLSGKPKATPRTPKENPNYRAQLAAAHWDDVIVAMGGMITTSACFSVFKARAIGNSGYGFDTMFIAWDRAIFGGQDPWRLTHAIFESPRITQVIDILYHPAFLPMFLGFLVCVVLQRGTALRYTYMGSYLAGFVVVGMLLASTLHSAGPIYDGAIFGDGQTFAPLTARLAAQEAALGSDLSALFLQEYLLALHQADEVGLGGGISAMPSVHIVLAALWTFASWHINRILGATMTVYLGVIWLGSVHLGWHYFVDGLVALAVIGIIWAAIGHFVGLYGRA